jgi:hypothetical protein
MIREYPASDIAEQGRLEQKFTSLWTDPGRDEDTRPVGRDRPDRPTGRSATRDADVRNLTPDAAFLRLHKRQRLNFMASIKDPSDTHGRLIAADQVEGTTIYNPAGDNLGSVEDVMIDKVSGKIAYAVVGFGGFLGIGEAAIIRCRGRAETYDTNMGGFVVDLDKRIS